MFTTDRSRRFLSRSPLSIHTDSPPSEHNGSRSSGHSEWISRDCRSCHRGVEPSTRSDHNDDDIGYSNINRTEDAPNSQLSGNKRRMDPEKSAAFEHVVLSATGLDCSGCGKQLTDVLSAIPGVANVRVNFVAGQADFDLVDPATADVHQIIRKVERATAFKCVRIGGGRGAGGSQDANIDVLMDKGKIEGDVAAATRHAPAGVIQITPLSKKAARITYDPHVVGPRTLVRSSLVDGGLAQWISGLAPLDLSDPVAAAGRRRLWAMLVKTVVAALFTIPVAVFSWAEVPSDMRLRGILLVALATPVQALAVQEFYIPAISALVFSRRVEMDMLVVLSITAAFVYSVVAVVFTIMRNPLEVTEFFETSTLLITLVLLGRLIAAYARMKAISSVSTRTLQPATATVREDGELKEIDARLLQYGDVFVVGPHTKIPTDGLVIDGVSEVDESMITGESLPTRKARKMPVIAGTINGTGNLTVRLTRLPGRNTVTDIAGLVEEASSQKPQVQDLADRVAGWFVPVVLVIAIIVLVVWLGINFAVRHEDAGAGVGESMTFAIAVLAISCPCALGLAVPMVLVVAGGVAARGGVVIKSAESTARVHKVTDVVFDKTGTITTGKLQVLLEEHPWAGTNLARMREVGGIARALVQDNKHPVSVAVAKHLEQSPADERVTNVRSIPGSGIEATLRKSTVRAGNARWLRVESVPAVARIVDAGMTTLCVTRDDHCLAIFGLKSSPRPEAAAVVKELFARGIDVHLVSGDEEMAVDEISRAVGIPSHCALARRTPLEKKEYVEELQTTPIPGTKMKKKSKWYMNNKPQLLQHHQQQSSSPPQHNNKRKILFCGDGTNDAVAIARADVGVQCGSSSDLTRATADVVLVSGNLDALVHLLNVSRAAHWRIVVNFIWAGLYNVFGILLAAGAFVSVDARIPPAYAGLGELVSVLPVVLVAATLGIRARLRGRRVRKRDRERGMIVYN